MIDMNKEKTWTIVHKKWKAPMNKWAGGGKITGPFRRVTFDLSKAVRFESKEKALYKLDEIYIKYGERVNVWKPLQIKNLKPISITLRNKK